MTLQEFKDMKIPFFEQSVNEFIHSKTNWLGMTSVVVGIVGYNTGMSPSMVASSIMGGLSLLFIRDGIAK